MVQVVATKFRDNVRKDTLAATKNVAAGKLELVMSAIEPLVQKYVELITEQFGAMCTTNIVLPTEVPSDAEFDQLERTLAGLRDVVELKTDQVRILRDQVLQVASDQE